MKLDQAVQRLYGYQGFAKRLADITPLLAALGNPQELLRFVHVAGTNGKGSVCAMVHRALRSGGVWAGLYTSPYLEHFAQRVVIGDDPADGDALADALETAIASAEAIGGGYVQFQLLTAAALLLFARASIHTVVLETGIGGRLDATNAVAPVVSAITSIGYDHMDCLGDTLERIAAEKAGIIKPGTPVVSAPQQPDAMRAIQQAAKHLGSPLITVKADDIQSTYSRIDRQEMRYQGRAWTLSLPGAFQRENAAVAIETLLCLRHVGYAMEEDTIAQGLLDAKWPGRLEWLPGDVLLDGAHNVEATAALADAIAELLPGRPVVLLCAVMADKPAARMAEQMARFAKRAVATELPEPRRLPAAAWAQVLQQAGIQSEAITNPAQALARAQALRAPGDVLVICGSLHLAGTLRRYFIPSCV